MAWICQDVAVLWFFGGISSNAVIFANVPDGQ
jgi:hypothetical protein